jgi:cbb3-type cytochrome oxidase subunit 3
MEGMTIFARLGDKVIVVMLFILLIAVVFWPVAYRVEG